MSLKGHIVITTCNGAGLEVDIKKPGTVEKAWSNVKYAGQPYIPQIYPGRMRWGEIHIFDRHGKKIAVDAVPGMGHLNGIGIDKQDNLYMLAASRRLAGGKKFDPAIERDVSGTLIKVPSRTAKVLSAGGRIPIPLSQAARPKRPAEIQGYTTGWIEGAEWFYGGIGFCVPGGCVCWNSRFDLDYFNRSFAPEPLHFTVAVLDSNGNLILRVGQYGNADDGKPLVSTRHSLRGVGPNGPEATLDTRHSLGGDEVGLVHACYVASHTDRRLFIADGGNACIRSVKLGYHVEERVPIP